jgi:hypothetical protein
MICVLTLDDSLLSLVMGPLACCITAAEDEMLAPVRKKR